MKDIREFTSFGAHSHCLDLKTATTLCLSCNQLQVQQVSSSPLHTFSSPSGAGRWAQKLTMQCQTNAAPSITPQICSEEGDLLNSTNTDPMILVR